MSSNKVYFVYFVYRNISGKELHCTDLIGKIGKGSGDRTSVYRTPFGTDDLKIDIWNCESEKQALQLENIILDLLYILGWLRIHSSGKRSEVLNFPLYGKNTQKIIANYKSRISYIKSLIENYHQYILNNSEKISFAERVLTSLRKKYKNGIFQLKDLDVFTDMKIQDYHYGLEYLYERDIYIKNIDPESIQFEIDCFRNKKIQCIIC